MSPTCLFASCVGCVLRQAWLAERPDYNSLFLRNGVVYTCLYLIDVQVSLLTVCATVYCFALDK